MADKETKAPNQSQSEENVMAAVATIPLVGLIMYFGMKDLKPLVRHYARQSIGVLLLIVAHSVIWFVGIILSPVLIGALILCLDVIFGLVIFVLWIVLVINALQGNKFVMPVVTEFVDNLIKE